MNLLIVKRTPGVLKLKFRAKAQIAAQACK